MAVCSATICLTGIMLFMYEASASSQQEEDGLLVKRVTAGDQGAFEELYNRYRHKVFSLSYRMTGNTSDAEDLCQEIFVQVFRKIGSFEGRSSFSTWLYRVATNRSRDFLRKKKRTPNLVSRDDQMLESDPVDHPGDHEKTGEPETRALSSEAQALVQNALLELPVNLRTPLVLHEFEGFQYQEIARLLRLPVGTVKSRIFRARIKLAEILEPHKEHWR